MRAVFSIGLILTLIFSGSYLYLEAQAICAVPLEYRIGTLDDRFGLSFEEARLAVADAEAAWEDSTERNLFTYNETADFAINFIFDERQAFADAEGQFKDRLDATEGMTDAMRATYDQLIARHKTESAYYEAAVAAYEERLAVYNEKVEQYNAEGGAPPGTFGELQAQKRELDKEQVKLNQEVAHLNELVNDINRVGDRSNQLIDTYNRNVETFNQTFGESREFTQGDYQGDRINIYTFKNLPELRLVLAHELGHALSLGHTNSKTSVMYYLLGAQADHHPTAADLELFESICGASTIERITWQVSDGWALLREQISN